MNTSQRHDLLAVYRADPSRTDLRNQIILANLPWIKYIARGYMGRVNCGVDPDDLINSGVLAVIKVLDAIADYGGLSFTAMTRWPIMNAMLPVANGTSRTQAAKRIRIHNAIGMATAASENRPNLTDLAETCDVTEQQIAGLLMFMAATRPEHNELALSFVGSPSDPDEIAAAMDAIVFREMVLRLLNSRHRFIVEQIYFEDKTMDYIAEKLGLTRARVGQIHDEILARLRAHLSRWDRHYCELDVVPSRRSTAR